MAFAPTMTEVKAYLKTYKDKNCKPISKLSNNELRSLARSYGFKGRGQATEMKTEQPEAPAQKTRKPNAWLLYVKEVKKNNPNMAYKNVMQLAKESYVKGGSSPTPPVSRKKTPSQIPIPESSRQEEKKEMTLEGLEKELKKLQDNLQKVKDKEAPLNKIIDDTTSTAKQGEVALNKKNKLKGEKLTIIKAMGLIKKQIKEMKK